MPFITNCPHKGCRKETQPVVDKKDNKAYCSECDREILLTSFMITSLISMGQIKRHESKQVAFGVICDFCNKKETPKLGKKKEILCGFCSKDITSTLSEMYVNMLRQNLSNRDNI